MIKTYPTNLFFCRHPQGCSFFLFISLIHTWYSYTGPSHLFPPSPLEVHSDRWVSSVNWKVFSLHASGMLDIPHIERTTFFALSHRKADLPVSKNSHCEACLDALCSMSGLLLAHIPYSMYVGLISQSLPHSYFLLLGYVPACTGIHLTNFWLCAIDWFDSQA